MKKEKVNRWYLTIEKEVPSNIFERPNANKRLNLLTECYKDAIDSRIKEIRGFLDMKPCQELSYENIYALFKSYFCNYIANEAVHMAFMEQNTYNIYENIMSLLTKGQMQAAIYGKPMIDAFSRAIRLMPKNTASEEKLHDIKIFALNEHYISTKKKNNYCGECKCSCSCDEGCNGDSQKCTSTKECNHHCGCYVHAMIENWPDKNRTIPCHNKSNQKM